MHLVMIIVSLLFLSPLFAGTPSEGEARCFHTQLKRGAKLVDAQDFCKGFTVGEAICLESLRGRGVAALKAKDDCLGVVKGEAFCHQTLFKRGYTFKAAKRSCGLW